jgi:hypothetical protein
MDQIPSAAEQYMNCSLSEIHHCLRASRRRLVVSLVAHRTFSAGGLQFNGVDFQSSTPDTVISVRQLAREIVAIEESISIDHATGEPYHNVYNSLIQTHLPKLDDIRAIAYDSDRKRIAPDSNLIVLSMVAAITSPVAQMFFHNAVTDTSETEKKSGENSIGD